MDNYKQKSVQTQAADRKIWQFRKIARPNDVIAIKIDSSVTDPLIWLDEGLPTPTYIKDNAYTYVLIWVMKGKFKTNAAIAARNYLIERLEALLHGKRIFYRPRHEDPFDRFSWNTYDLSDFHGMKDLRKKAFRKRFAEQREKDQAVAFFLPEDDRVFEWARWAIYESKTLGTLSVENSYLIIKEAYARTGAKKGSDRASMMARARNMTAWTEKHFTPPKYETRKAYFQALYKSRTKKEKVMTRTEAAAVASAALAAKTRAKIEKAVLRLQKAGKKINVSTVAKEAKTGRNAARKYLPEFVQP